MESCEVQVAAVHHVERAGFQGDFVEHVHIVDPARRHAHKSWDVRAQVQQCIHFHRSLGFPEQRPGEKGEAEVESGGVQGVGGLVQFGGQAFLGIQFAGLPDQDLSEIGKDPPVPGFVGMGQGGSEHPSPKAHVVETSLVGPEAGFDVAKTFPERELGEGHGQELIPAGKPLGSVIALVSQDALLELVGGEKRNQLGKDGFAGIHEASSE